MDEREWFQDTCDCFAKLGFTDGETDSIFRILSGVLHLGNLEFVGDESVSFKDPELLNLICELWGVMPGVTKQALLTRQLQTGWRHLPYLCCDLISKFRKRQLYNDSFKVPPSNREQRCACQGNSEIQPTPPNQKLRKIQNFTTLNGLHVGASKIFPLWYLY